MRLTEICPSEERCEVVSWSTGPYTVNFPRMFDLGGTLHAAPLSAYIKERIGRTSLRTLEIFSGPGFIGLQCLSDGLACGVDFADINPQSIACIHTTIKCYALEEQCRAYSSDIFESIPLDSRYDLIVGNPPWSYQTQGDYSDENVNDLGWVVHKRFWNQVASFLSPGGFVALLEWKPFETRPSGSGRKDWDIRPRPPADDFRDMIHSAGLQCMEIAPLRGSWEGLHVVFAQSTL